MSPSGIPPSSLFHSHSQGSQLVAWVWLPGCWTLYCHFTFDSYTGCSVFSHSCVCTKPRKLLKASDFSPVKDLGVYEERKWAVGLKQVKNINYNRGSNNPCRWIFMDLPLLLYPEASSHSFPSISHLPSSIIHTWKDGGEGVAKIYW